MSKKDAGGQASPVPAPRAAEGMTLRDYFAAEAMAAVIAHHGIYEEDSNAEGLERLKRQTALTFDQAAEYGYGQADAMLAERAK